MQRSLDKLPMTLAYNSVLTTIRVLERKKYIKHIKDGRAHIYQPVVKRDEATRSAIRHLVGRSCNRRRRLVLNILHDEKISATELKRLRQMLDRSECEYTAPPFVDRSCHRTRR